MHADALFQGLIQRKMKADATRNTLTVLQRYRFLFNLPRSIEKNIKNVSTCQYMLLHVITSQILNTCYYMLLHLNTC